MSFQVHWWVWGHIMPTPSVKGEQQTLKVKSSYHMCQENLFFSIKFSSLWPLNNLPNYIAVEKITSQALKFSQYLKILG
jgi:hypothetical protein